MSEYLKTDDVPGKGHRRVHPEKRGKVIEPHAVTVQKLVYEKGGGARPADTGMSRFRGRFGDHFGRD